MNPVSEGCFRSTPHSNRDNAKIPAIAASFYRLILEMDGSNQTPLESVLSFVAGKPTQDKEQLRERGCLFS